MNPSHVQPQPSTIERTAWSMADDAIAAITAELCTRKNPGVLELGTHHGYSALRFSPHARIVVTIENDLKFFETAQAHLEHIPNIRTLFGDARAIIPTLHEKFDVIIIDAKKSEYATYLTLCLEKIKPGGVIFADNTLSHTSKLGAFFTLLEKLAIDWRELGTHKGLVRIESPAQL